MTPTRYRRSPFLLVSWEGEDHLVTDCHAFRQYRLSRNVTAVLDELSEPKTADEVAHALPGHGRALVTAILRRLAGTGLVHPEDGPHARLPAHWSLFELAVQRQTSYGRLRERRLPGPPPPLFKPAPEDAVSLPAPLRENGVTVAAAVAARRSVRQYSPEPLSLDELGGFLQATARVQQVLETPWGSRARLPYPTSGGAHSLEVYALCERVEGLDPGVYHYDAVGHALAFLEGRDARYRELLEIVDENTSRSLNRSPCVVFVVTAVFQRLMHSYERLSLATIYREVGCLYQTMYLVATDLGLAPCALAGIQDLDNASWLGMDPLEEAQVGCFILGKPEAAA